MGDVRRLTKEEMIEIVNSFPVNIVKDKEKVCEYFKGYDYSDIAVILNEIYSNKTIFFMAKFSQDRTVTYQEFLKYYDLAQLHFIVVHRVIYIAHQAMVDVYDILEKEKRLRFMTKRKYALAESEWSFYEKFMSRMRKKEAWYVLQDHLRLTHDALYPRLEKVYESIRNGMIGIGWRDVEVKARIELALILSKVAIYTFNDFFIELQKKVGVDYSAYFVYADISKMLKYFIEMSESLCIKIVKDSHGFPVIEGFDPNSSQRIEWAWKDFMKDLQNDDLMDETALRAIGMNDDIQEDYKMALAEEERKRMDAGIIQLRDKFNVTKNK